MVVWVRPFNQARCCCTRSGRLCVCMGVCACVCPCVCVSYFDHVILATKQKKTERARHGSERERERVVVLANTRSNGIILQHLILCLSVLHPSCMSLSEETHFSCLVQGTDTSGISNQHLFVTLPLGLSAMCAFLKGSVCGK